MASTRARRSPLSINLFSLAYYYLLWTIVEDGGDWDGRDEVITLLQQKALCLVVVVWGSSFRGRSTQTNE